MGELAPLGTGANRVLRARVSFSLKVESLRDEHPEVRKRLGSFECLLKQGAIGMPTKCTKVLLFCTLSITTTTTSICIAINTQNAMT